MIYLILMLIFSRPSPIYLTVSNSDTLKTDTLKTDTVHVIDKFINKKKYNPVICYNIIFVNESRNTTISLAPSLRRMPRITDISGLIDTSKIEYSYHGCIEEQSTLNVNLGSEYYYQTTVTTNQVTTQKTETISSGFLLNISPIESDSMHTLFYNMTVRNPVVDGQSYQTTSTSQKTRISFNQWQLMGSATVISWQRRIQWLGFLRTRTERNVNIYLHCFIQ